MYIVQAASTASLMEKYPISVRKGNLNLYFKLRFCISYILVTQWSRTLDISQYEFCYFKVGNIKGLHIRLQRYKYKKIWVCRKDSNPLLCFSKTKIFISFAYGLC